MKLKKRILLIFLLTTFSIWIASLLSVYLPISPWSGPTFPKVIDPNIMNFFVIMTVLSFSSFFVVGLREIFKSTTDKTANSA